MILSSRSPASWKAVSALPEIVRVYEESGVKFIATSRVSQLRIMREAGLTKKPLMLIRIPMLSELPDVVELSDISLQSDITVLRALNEEAKRQNKIHEVILMMDLGDLREASGMKRTRWTLHLRWKISSKTCALRVWA